MPFMRGEMPLRRTIFFLQQGKVILRDNVSVLMFGYHTKPLPEQNGLNNFVFWHWAQVQFKNPHIQMLKEKNYCPTPFIMAFLNDGREILFDLENKNKDEIIEILQTTLGKTLLVKKREHLERMQDHNPADFGGNCKRHCICEVQGQHPCTSLLIAPDYMKGKWRWNLNAK